MKKPNLEIMNTNLFLVLEQYLVTYSQELKEKIKELSHSLTVRAVKNFEKKVFEKLNRELLHVLEHGDEGAAEKIRRKLNDIKISTDGYQLELFEIIKEEAKEALPYSARLSPNGSILQKGEQIIDPFCIFKLSKQQEREIFNIKEEIISACGNVDGLIFSYDAYIERQKDSKISYCEGFEAIAYDHNSLLSLKAKSLFERGHNEAARILSHTCCSIKEQLQSSSPKKYQQISEILQKTKNNPLIQAHRGEVKTLIVNFLLMLSVVGVAYLAGTARQRSSFWYRPNTDTENKVDKFHEELKMQMFGNN